MSWKCSIIASFLHITEYFEIFLTFSTRNFIQSIVVFGMLLNELASFHCKSRIGFLKIGIQVILPKTWVLFKIGLCCLNLMLVFPFPSSCVFHLLVSFWIFRCGCLSFTLFNLVLLLSTSLNSFLNSF